MDFYCKIFVNVELSDKQFIQWLSDQLSGETDERTITTSALEIDVIRSEDFDKKKLTESNGFIFYPYYLEVDMIGNVDEKVYKKNVSKILELIWYIGADAVAACDFEDELPSKVIV